MQGTTMHDNARPFDPAKKWRLSQHLEPLIRFVAPLSYLVAVPILYRLHPLAPLLLVGVLPLVLFIVESMPGSCGAGPGSEGIFVNRLAVWLTIAVQLALIGWGAVMSAGPGQPDIAVLAITIGLGAGVFGMLAAHEMIHSRSRLENTLGLLMLTVVTYRHFQISHLFGHHRWAATPDDPATARRGENAYAFLWRSILGQAEDVYRLEQGRIGRRLSWRNRVLHDLVVYLAIYSSIFAVLGLWAAVFMAAQSIIAVIVLELFNYVAHYGLVRGTLPSGEPEPLSDIHSWNVESEVGNWLLLDMGHHSDHHRRPPPSGGRSTPIEQTPLLPAGYSGAILLALVPPLWRQHMDCRVEHWMVGEQNGQDNERFRKGTPKLSS
jgi:alkane 1-monooxygenase